MNEEDYTGLATPGMTRSQGVEMLEWILQHCQGEVLCDISLTPCAEYLRRFGAIGDDTPSHYLRFSEPKDAMLFKLSWPAYNMTEVQRSSRSRYDF